MAGRHLQKQIMRRFFLKKIALSHWTRLGELVVRAVISPISISLVFRFLEKCLVAL